MPRAFVIVLDSAGIGATPDAVRYGDAGADTIGHIAQACATGMADRA
jgi:phosphopentomutase